MQFVYMSMNYFVRIIIYRISTFENVRYIKLFDGFVRKRKYLKQIM